MVELGEVSKELVFSLEFSKEMVLWESSVLAEDMMFCLVLLVAEVDNIDWEVDNIDKEVDNMDFTKNTVDSASAYRLPFTPSRKLPAYSVSNTVTQVHQKVADDGGGRPWFPI